jgi:hypothetical protein
VIVLLVGAFLTSAAWAGSTHIEGGLTVQVEDREKAIASVVATAEGAGGWFSALSDDAVTVQVPVDSAAKVLESGRSLGVVVDRSWSAQALDTELVDLQARLSSRQSVLERYLGILGTTNASAVVSVEREIARTVAEIEQIEGRIRFLTARADYAQLSFAFQFRDRAAPTRDGSSSFPWLNTLNLADLQEAFRSGDLRHHSRGVKATAPEGFAPGRKGCRFSAISPDDVVMRVRTDKTRRAADLAFWKEAMRTRMKDAGYHVVSEGDITSASGPGALLELSAPDGQQDDTYLVALFVDGRRLVIVEAAGEVSRFAPRREAILASIRGMEW